MNGKIFIIDNELLTELLCNVLNVNDISTYADEIYIDTEHIYNSKKKLLIRIEIDANDIYLEDVFINAIDTTNNSSNIHEYRYNTLHNRLYYIKGEYYIDTSKLKLYGFNYMFEYVINVMQTFDKLIKAGIIEIESPSAISNN